MSDFRPLCVHYSQSIRYKLFALFIALCFTAVGCTVYPREVLVIGINTQPSININTATKAELMTLPGIGEMLAERIIRGRPYHTIEDLVTLEGLGPKRMANLRSKVTVK